MFTYSQVEEKLTKSKWSAQSIEKLLPSLPRLGNWSLSFLLKQLDGYGEGDDVYNFAEVIADEPYWYEALQNNQIDPITQTVKEALESESELVSRATLAVVLDVRFNKGIAELVPSDLSRLFDELEIRYFKDLPMSEISAMLSTRIHNLFSLSDLAMEIKTYCYYREILDADEIEVITFKQALEGNTQLIGTDRISVKDWISDFMQTAATSTDRSAYNVVYYMTNSPKVKNLSQAERNALSSILKLYYWLLKPSISSEEIITFEDQKFGNNDESQNLVQDTEPDEVDDLPQVETQTQPPVQSLQEFQSQVQHPIKYESQAPAPKQAPVAVINQPLPPQQSAKPMTDEQRRILEDIRNSRKGKVNYNGDANAAGEISGEDAARLHDLINKNTAQSRLKRGVTMDPTNIKIDEEKKRIDDERFKRVEEIDSKLGQLRNRNKN